MGKTRRDQTEQQNDKVCTIHKGRKAKTQFRTVVVRSRKVKDHE